MSCGCHRRALRLENLTGVSALVWHALVVLAIAGLSALAVASVLGWV